MLPLEVFVEKNRFERFQNQRLERAQAYCMPFEHTPYPGELDSFNIMQRDSDRALLECHGKKLHTRVLRVFRQFKRASATAERKALWLEMLKLREQLRA